MLPGVGDHVVERREIKALSRGLDIDPTTLATKVAAIYNREVKKGRKIFSAFDPPFELFDRKHPFDPKIPRELPKQPLVRRTKDAGSETGEHKPTSFCLGPVLEHGNGETIWTLCSPSPRPSPLGRGRNFPRCGS
jgi:hypothetical protein